MNRKNINFRINNNKLIIAFFFLPFSFQACNTQEPTDLVEKWSKMHSAKQENLEWFTDAKFGMFIHWGLYSIPAGIWKGKTMEEMGRPYVAEWIQCVAKIPRDEYALLAKEFNPVLFNADSIACLARDAGMKYLVFTAKHADGFAMYHSKASKFNIIDASPFKRDVVKELYDACRKYGIGFGIYYIQSTDWAEGGDNQYSVIKKMNDQKGLPTRAFGVNTWDPSPHTFEEYLENKAFPQIKELLTSFPGLKILWYDHPHYTLPEQSFEFYRLASSIQPDILINERVGNGFGDYDIPGDNKIPADPDNILKPWETVGTLNNSWGYKSYDHDWKSPKELLYWLIEIVSKGGNYMLNIGPKATGEVPQESIMNLREIGRWLNINGEAIYNTHRWKTSHEGPSIIEMEGTDSRQQKGFSFEFSPEDFWFTSDKNHIYAIALETPINRKVVIRSMNDLKESEIVKIRIPGSDYKPEWRLTSSGLEVNLPEVLPSSLGYVIAIEVK